MTTFLIFAALLFGLCVIVGLFSLYSTAVCRLVDWACEPSTAELGRQQERECVRLKIREQLADTEAFLAESRATLDSYKRPRFR